MMAEINESGNGRKRRAGTLKHTKLSTRIDLTPMVDLGFLLITFFLFTTTLAKPKVMTVNMPFIPHTDAEPTTLSDVQSMTIVLSKNHQLYYYNGIGDNPDKPPTVRLTDFNVNNGIRDVIIGKIKSVRLLQQQGIIRPAQHAAFLIKPDTNSTYEDFVQILDELSINDVQLKAVVNITAADHALIATIPSN